MKKLAGVTTLVLAVFTLFYFSNTALAGKAAFVIGPSSELCDVSNGDNANFQISDLDGATSVRVEARIVDSGSPFTTVTGLGSITSTGTYQRTAAQMETQYGDFLVEWRLADNNKSSHVSGLCQKTIQP